MKRSLIAAIIIAFIIFGEVLVWVEMEYAWWQMLLGFTGVGVLGASAFLSRNAFIIFAVVLITLLGSYFGWIFELRGLAPGSIGGLLVGSLFQWGWFGPYGRHYSKQRSKLTESTGSRKKTKRMD